MVKNPPAMQETPVDSWIGKIPWRRERLPTPVFQPRELHGMGSQKVGHNWATFTFIHHLSCEDKWVIQYLSHSILCSVSDSETPWTAASQASLSFTISRSLLKLLSIESVMLSKHLILCHPLLLLPSIFPESGSFPVSQFASGGQSIETSASASVLPMNIRGWFSSGLTHLIS